jgi:hypothetical protein
MKRSDTETEHADRNQAGLCEEAQADGVPCYELGRQCETCERARPEPARLSAPPQPKPRTKKR